MQWLENPLRSLLGVGSGVIVGYTGHLYLLLLWRKPEDLPRGTQVEETEDGKNNGQCTCADGHMSVIIAYE